MALTQDAKDAIADAIRIVREDRFEKFARERLSQHTTPKNDAGNGANGDAQKGNGQTDVTPPPAKDSSDQSGQGGQPPTDGAKPRSLYWGEIDSD